MISTDQIRQNLFDLLAVKDFDITTRDAKGKETGDPKDADLFSFDYKIGDTNYGTVVITITPAGALEVFYGDRLGRSMELQDKSDWYDFLYQLRHFSRRNMLGFELKHMNKLKNAMKTMAAVNEGKYYGYKNTSYTKPTKGAKLKIVHSKPIDEEQGDQRYRNVASLYVENAEGERFKLPFTKLYAGRAMARHISEGGKPYDEFGSHISEMVDDIKVLEQFLRSARGKEWTDAGADLMVETGIRHLAGLKKKVKKMIGKRGYREEIDTFNPQQEQEHSETTDKIREMFTQTLLDTRIEDAIPVLNKLEARDSVMKEITEFEDWAEETTALDMEEGFDPDSFDGQITVPGLNNVPTTIKYTAEVDKEQNTVHVTKCSNDQYKEECQADAEAEWDARDADVPMEDVDLDEGKMKDLMTDIDELTDEEFEEKYKTKKPEYPGINKKMDEGKMKDLALDLEELSDEEFEEKYQTKKSDWDEVKTKELRADPNKKAYISKDMKMKDMAGVLAAEDEVYEGPTRKDFQMVADLLKNVDDPQKKKDLANHHADMFAKQNPRFDKERFLKAAGIMEDDMEEGNEFTEKLAQAKAQGKREFEVDGKVYQVKESELDRIKHLAGM